jgi:opacity protein-like surface antigen
VGGGFIYSPSDAVTIDFGGGYSLQRKFNFDRADMTFKTDPAPYLRLEIKAKF